jgi:hydroxymethylpyrimidine pyrophosphatase-like HAD family hydrolase
MQYHILATDYDGTLATHGHVGEETLSALGRLLATGRRLVMVTGRELPELLTVFPHTHLFEWIVAENGALLYRPSTQEERLLCDPPSDAFVAALKLRGVAPMSVGRVIVATWEPHEQAVLETIRELGLERQVIFNKGAVMILPTGINKATGLIAALKEMSLTAENVVSVGDAENDHAFLQMSGLSAAVANALPAVKDTADITLKADHGAGVAELIDLMIVDDLAEAGRTSRRRRVKFVEGELASEDSFYFRGPEGKLKLRAQNLAMFLQIADGVDDATWEFHRKQGDYSRWLRDSIGDHVLAVVAKEVEQPAEMPAEQGRTRLREAIERDYIVPSVGNAIAPDTSAN